MPLKKPSNISLSKGPRKYRYFVDRNLGSVFLPEQLRNAGIDIAVHDDLYTQTERDPWIFYECGRKNLILEGSTSDTLFMKSFPHMAAVALARTRVLPSLNNNHKSVVRGAAFIKGRPQIEKALAAHKRDTLHRSCRYEGRFPDLRPSATTFSRDMPPKRLGELRAGLPHRWSVSTCSEALERGESNDAETSQQRKPIPHIPLPFEEVMKDVLKVKPPAKAAQEDGRSVKRRLLPLQLLALRRHLTGPDRCGSMLPMDSTAHRRTLPTWGSFKRRDPEPHWPGDGCDPSPSQNQGV